MKTISIANHKGGTGKTSMSIGLASYFAKKGFKVLIIDMDPQGHVSPGLGIDVEYEDRSMADILAGDSDITSIIISSPIKGLDIAPANIRLINVKETLYNTFRRETRLKKALQEITTAKRYDLVIIDCPPSIGPLMENAIIVSDYCLIPCEPSSRSIDGLADFIGKIKEIRDGELDENWYIVMSRVKKRATLTNEVIENKLRDYKDRILSSRIYESEVVNQAQIAGVPVFDFPRSDMASENLTMLAKEVSKICRIKPKK